MSSDLFGSDESIGVGLRNVSLECGLSDKVLDAGLGKWMSEERFREEDDELDVSVALVVIGNKPTGFRNSRKFCRRRTWK